MSLLEKGKIKMNKLILIFFALLLSACGDVQYKTTTGSGEAQININDQDGSVIVDAQDQSDVNVATVGSETTDSNNEALEGLPVNPISNVEEFAIVSDICKNEDGTAVSAETCAARFSEN